MCSSDLLHQDLEDVRHGHLPRGEVQVDLVGPLVGARQERVVAVGDQDLGTVAGLAERGEDLRRAPQNVADSGENRDQSRGVQGLGEVAM